MHRLHRDCGIQKGSYLQAALKFLDKFCAKTISDRSKVQALLDNNKVVTRKLQKKAHAGRETYGKAFVSSRPHDWDDFIEASSSVGGETEASATTETEEAMASD